MSKVWITILATNLVTAGILLSINANQAQPYQNSVRMHDQHCPYRQMMQATPTAGPNFDRQFIDAMIPHHEAAIKMAEEALKSANHQEIKNLARNIINTQQKEIDEMRKWRTQWYGSS